MKSHIEGIVQEASIVLRGHNHFILLKVDDGSQLHVTAWFPEFKTQELPMAKRWPTDGLFKTHYGDFSNEDVQGMVGKFVKADARQKELGVYFFTTAFELKDIQLAPEDEKAIQEAMAPEPEAVPEATPEAPAEEAAVPEPEAAPKKASKSKPKKKRR